MPPGPKIVVSSVEARQQCSGLLEVVDELVVSEETREALARDRGGRVELAEVVREAGFEPVEFGL